MAQPWHMQRVVALIDMDCFYCACERALARLREAAAAMASLKSPPSEPLRPIAPAQRWRVAFRGEYVHVRSEPSTAAAARGQLARDSTFDVDAARGAWLRVASTHGRLVAGGWVLSAHPVHGTLVARVEDY